MTFSRARLVRHAALAVCVLLLLASALSATAHAQGQTWQYSYSSNSCSDTSISDPITLVFVGARYNSTLDVHFRDHLPLWTSTSTTVDQYAPDVDLVCKGMTWHRSDGGNLATSRYHTRFLEFGYANAEPDPYSNGWHLHLTPHRERIVLLCLPPGHAVYPDGFNEAKVLVHNTFTPSHSVIKWAEWGNTRAMRQCNGDQPRSDGYTIYFFSDHESSG